MPLRICHTTRFAYDAPAYQSHNEVRMRPMEGAQQHLLDFALEVDPPAAVFEYRDYYGNDVHAFSVHQQHDMLSITARSLVNCAGDDVPSLRPVSFEEFLAEDRARMQTFFDFLGASPHVPFSEKMKKFFWLTRPRQSDDVSAYVAQVVRFVRDQFAYEPGVTHVHSTVEEILSVGAGVCQDFAHLTIAILRLAGVPSRYVSGYLAPAANGLQNAPAEQASHAWIEAQLPRQGWTGFDPTHGCRTDARHIKVAIGRDYSDVTPLRGVYRSCGNKQTMTVELKLEREGQNQEQKQNGFSQQQQQ
ncbi:MAG TPA: transglutaminase family protein [Candidatus Binataceae bacterium]|nr:transglutaminase family protein [Candidatus Binataceae bacterium]